MPDYIFQRENYELHNPKCSHANFQAKAESSTVNREYNAIPGTKLIRFLGISLFHSGTPYVGVQMEQHITMKNSKINGDSKSIPSHNFITLQRNSPSETFLPSEIDQKLSECLDYMKTNLHL